jgi:hypothetical protein
VAYYDAAALYPSSGTTFLFLFFFFHVQWFASSLYMKILQGEGREGRKGKEGKGDRF